MTRLTAYTLRDLSVCDVADFSICDLLTTSARITCVGLILRIRECRRWRRSGDAVAFYLWFINKSSELLPLMMLSESDWFWRVGSVRFVKKQRESFQRVGGILGREQQLNLFPASCGIWVSAVSSPVGWNSAPSCRPESLGHFIAKKTRTNDPETKIFGHQWRVPQIPGKSNTARGRD